MESMSFLDAEQAINKLPCQDCQSLFQIFKISYEEKEAINLKKQNECLKEENNRLRMEAENRHVV